MFFLTQLLRYFAEKHGRQIGVGVKLMGGLFNFVGLHQCEVLTIILASGAINSIAKKSSGAPIRLVCLSLQLSNRGSHFPSAEYTLTTRDKWNVCVSAAALATCASQTRPDSPLVLPLRCHRRYKNHLKCHMRLSALPRKFNLHSGFGCLFAIFWTKNLPWNFRQEDFLTQGYYEAS